MILYLGMPRCASTWIYHNLGFTGTKETHYLYTLTTNPVWYAKRTPIDFSTNNWSMDSDVAESIDPYVTKYIFIYREPLELAKSYYKFLKHTMSFTDFVQGMIDAKLLCLGDILERWINLVDSKKIFVYNYNDIDDQWLHTFVKDMELADIQTVSQKFKNSSTPIDIDFTITDKQQATLDQQWNKLQLLIKDHNYGNH